MSDTGSVSTMTRAAHVSWSSPCRHARPHLRHAYGRALRRLPSMSSARYRALAFGCTSNAARRRNHVPRMQSPRPVDAIPAGRPRRTMTAVIECKITTPSARGSVASTDLRIHRAVRTVSACTSATRADRIDICESSKSGRPFMSTICSGVNFGTSLGHPIDASMSCWTRARAAL
uniref:Uncharacterized protein n=1 Tax=uncultured organism TaxID=155900 RepID=A0A7L9QC31_9ZZZZ|nr:hypothetical protein [uncultured organism]